jgi:hypothetical protein
MKLIAFVLISLCIVSGAFAQPEFYVAKNRPEANDANPCTTPAAPCKTVQGAVKKAPTTVLTNVYILADGDVPVVHRIGADEEGIDVADWKRVHFNGDCNNRQKVVLEGARPGQIIVWAQHSSLIVTNCLTMRAAPGVTAVKGFVLRKFSMGNWRDTRFEEMQGGAHILISEQSSGAPQGLTEIAGNASVHLAISGQSWVAMASHTNIDAVSFDVFITLNNFSVLDMTGATFSGGPVKGRKYISQGFNDLTLPAGGIPGDQPGEVVRRGVKE